MTRDAPVLEVRALTAGYGEVDVVHSVELTLPPRAIVTVIGPNGAGKSTLLKAIYGLLPPRSGSVLLRGRNVAAAMPHALTRLGMNYVPQLDNVFPRLSVLENLEIGAIAHGKERRERVENALEWFPFLRARRRQRAGTLSGGERKMLALARALAGGPEVLLLDEPSAALAPTLVDTVFEKLVEINAAGIAILIVEQNARRALALSSYGYVLDMGRNRVEGTGHELLHDARVLELYLGGG